MPYFCENTYGRLSCLFCSSTRLYRCSLSKLFSHLFRWSRCLLYSFVRLENGNKFRNRDISDIDPLRNSVPILVPQVMASIPEELRSILCLFEKQGYTRADLNLGCPFPLLVKRHKGSGILPFPEEVEALLKVFLEFPAIDFSIKARLGWESADEIFRLLPLLEKYPVSRVVLHPRLGIQQYKGKPI